MSAPFSNPAEARKDLDDRRFYSGDPDRGGTAMLERCWPLIADLEEQLRAARQALFDAGQATGQYVRDLQEREEAARDALSDHRCSRYTHELENALRALYDVPDPRLGIGADPELLAARRMAEKALPSLRQT